MSALSLLRSLGSGQLLPSFPNGCYSLLIPFRFARAAYRRNFVSTNRDYHAVALGDSLTTTSLRTLGGDKVGAELATALYHLAVYHVVHAP
jgi:hypothetical protein